jgi:hypothetical protein
VYERKRDGEVRRGIFLQFLAGTPGYTKGKRQRRQTSTQNTHHKMKTHHCGEGEEREVKWLGYRQFKKPFETVGKFTESWLCVQMK